MPYDFKRALTRVIEPTGGPGAKLATLADAARFIGLMKTWCQARPRWDFAAELVLEAAQTRKERRIRPFEGGATHEADGFDWDQYRDGNHADGARAAGRRVVVMPHGSMSLGEAAAQWNMLRLRCPKCHRAGQYRIDRLLEQYGPDIALPDLRHELAQCPHRRK